ncbi:MAG: glycosyltransferase [Verrucomicrobiales bacterium]|nr:glycosyltransferase [Verrucomicrobiales bacterium]
MLLSKKLRTPHFHTPHSLGIWKRDNIGGDAEANERRWKFKSRIDMEQQVYRHAEVVIATTVEQEEILLTKYELSQAKVEVIPPGFDEERYMPETHASVERLRRRLGLPQTFVLSLGRLAHNKGYDLLLKAFALLVERHLIEDSVFLVLAAGGLTISEKDKLRMKELEQLARKLKIHRRIHWLGYVNDEDMAALYDCADVFVMPSRYEPFGMVAVEAMACGTPTVITTEGGLWRDLAYGRDVLFANSFKTEELAINIAMPLNYPRVSERLRRRGAMKAHSDYTWTSIAQRTLSLFQKSI